MVTAKIVLDPGHGGSGTVGFSDGNHAVSPSGVLEKNLTLAMAELVKVELEGVAASDGHALTILMTRSDDTNLGLSARANVARDNRADRFLSIHFNAFDGVARGVETYVRRAQDNINLAADRRFAGIIQSAVFNTIRGVDSRTRDRGVKEAKFGVLNDTALGNLSGGQCRACLLEVEFLDVGAVDLLFNTGPNAGNVRQQIARAIANGILTDLLHP
jgi:N-acetylmuramoyl-L-alanine amidase